MIEQFNNFNDMVDIHLNNVKDERWEAKKLDKGAVLDLMHTLFRLYYEATAILFFESLEGERGKQFRIFF